MKLPTFLTGHHLKSCRQWMTGVRMTCYFYTGIWTAIETSSYFIKPLADFLSGNWVMFIIIIIVCLLAGGIRFIRRCKKMLSVNEKLEEVDISIEIRVGDIFKLPGALIIATNTTFDTTNLSVESLLGQCCENYYDKKDHLNHDLEKALKNERGSLIQNSDEERKRYKFGTVVKITVQEQVIYLVAIDELNKEGGYSSSLENVRQSLTSLWQYIGERGSPGHLIIPAIGTKSAGIQVPRDVMTTEIIKSFIGGTYAGKKICEKLTIVIHEKDYHEQNIDLQELGNYLHTHAKQKKWEISEPQKPIGEPIQEELGT